MKDYSQYSYTDLYDIANHLDPFRYPDKIRMVKQEIERRRKADEIPDRLVPQTDWSPFKFWKKGTV